MRFGLLGPLAVWMREGTPVRVPETKVRALLADLLVHEGRPVAADRLVEDIWDGAPPSGAPGALRAKVSHLRRALDEAEAGGRNLVLHQPPGYRLRIGAEDTDAGRFEDLTRRARSTGDPRARRTLFSDALALWRGPALADFADRPFARGTAARLDERRLAAVEDLAETRLALGEHHLLTGELAAEMAEHPLRERLCALCARALYASGRQSAALTALAELRRRLRDELGADPGPEIAELQQAILRHDTDLAVPPPELRGPPPHTALPAPIADLIGRDTEVAHVRSLVHGRRLVTLVGPGGVGKTRLALEAARGLADSFPGGAALADLALCDPPAAVSPHTPAAEDTLITRIAAEALGIREETRPDLPGRPGTASRLARALPDRPLLLVLDNCEHVAESAARTAEALLTGAPNLRILATGREPLGVGGETLWHVEPLPLPEPDSPRDPSSLLHSSAVRLFTARAAALAPGFRLTADNAEHVAAVCVRLDGIPLALELAAARVRTLGVGELAERIEDRFSLLTTGPRGAPQRQRTLRATLDWSWTLLDGTQQAVLRRLAVHAGSWTISAAEAVAAADGVEPDRLLDILAQLVDRSLLAVHEHPDGPRYRMLESVTAYGLERLEAAGETSAAHERYILHYLALAEHADRRLRGPEQGRWLRRLDTETTNLRGALDRALRTRAAEPAARLALTLTWYWFLRGRFAEARQALEAVMALEGHPPRFRARAAAHRAAFATLLPGEPPADLTGDAALRLLDGIGDPAGQDTAAWFLGSAPSGCGGLAGRERLIARALAGFRGRRDRWGEAAALSTLAWHELLRGRLDTAVRDAQHSLNLFGELGDRWGELHPRRILAEAAQADGDLERAGVLLLEGLRAAEELGLWPEVSYTLPLLGRLALRAGDDTAAEERLERARGLAASSRDQYGLLAAELGLARLARNRGDVGAAERYLRPWLDSPRLRGAEADTVAVAGELGFLAEQRGDARAALRLHLRGLRAARATGDPRAVAFAMEGLAGARLCAGDASAAARLLGAAAAERSPGGPDAARLAAALREAMGAAAFAAEYERGRALGEDACRGLSGEDRKPIRTDP